MKKILSTFFVMLGALMFTLAVYQSNQYMQVSAALGPSLAQLNQLGSGSGADAAQYESAKQVLSATTNSILLAMFIDFVLGIVFLLVGYFTYNEVHGEHERR